MNLYCVWDEDEDEPMLLVSNQACNLLILYSQRMKIFVCSAMQQLVIPFLFNYNSLTALMKYANDVRD